ncbi:BlaI/MecI/CopY family transcriptional regulator [Nakamurella endophytica]|uniref:BlaI/MecI/CopY family transcriptional regulator n=1 Tax=Nakamurella endophytica TaxID=1748367 RepID=A0A917T3G3_9ACTN|nr:BlaI/MecI/CopY family transcriptional regulator [Nakamurella endophytica]GGM07834.1 hypothetical protein GCM10011594_29770 [Nakamurella endophytica]
MRKRQPPGHLEAEVLATLWAADHPLTTAEVADGLGDAKAYTTVQTILTRLHAKGAVDRQLVGRAHAYTPRLDDAGLAARRMRAVLDRENDRLAVLRHFVGILSPQEESAVAELLGPSERSDAEDE